ncbi:WD40-repeat-containing domain protein [Neurospora tetraspora]|uniref:WD40-repeat-containing domain protein n=1 Tax=Neurospora tetraspora TaxID=94610 RepID=A0AAE0J1J6_9PEZI|nr:WD40-repeat-containing domain protein [Neurospora tetraspora]
MAQNTDFLTSKLPTKLQHNFVLNPITALAFYHSPDSRVFVLAAEDSWLKIYDVATSRLVSQIKVFYSQPIHGLYVSQLPPLSSSTSASAAGEDDEPRVLIWGANSVAVIPQSTLDKLVRGESSDVEGVKEEKAADWIYDGILFRPDVSKGGEGEGGGKVQGALVTAHNEVVPLSIQGGSESSQKITFGPLTSPSRPILYSANLCLLDDENTILVAGGTVFGEIVVWKYYLDGRGEAKKFEVLYVFTGHEGSIFGVSISPEIYLSSGGEKIRLLASCSDDRAVRIWDITDSSPKELLTSAAATNGCSSENDHSKKALAEARETGFGGTNNSEVKLENQNDKARCLAVAMGHVSRIWQVRFTGRTQHGDGSPIEVHSFGEDATRQRWDLTLDQAKWKEALERGYGGEQDTAGSFGTLKNCGVVSCHNGKNMWSTAVSGGDGLPTLIATGGADGRITMAGDQAVVKGAETYGDIDVTLTVEDVMKVAEGVEEDSTAPVEGQKKNTTKNGFQRYAFLSENTLLATTSSGRLLHGTVGEGLTWKNVHLSETVLADLKSYYVVKSPVEGTAILGSSSGKVYLFLEDGYEIKELHTFPGKISDILLIEGAQETLHKEQPGAWTVIITVLGLDHALLMTFEPSTSSVTVDPRKIHLSSDDVNPFIATAAGFCGSKLILGSRVGAVAVYKSTSDDAYTLDYSRKDARTKDAVTCIVPLPGSKTSFLTGCRDGRYRIYTLTSTPSDSTTLHLQHEISPPLGMIEGARFTKTRSTGIDLIIHGFRGKNFVVWSESTRQELTTVECGGGHRAFDVVFPSSGSAPGPLRFVFTKASALRFYSQSSPPLRTLKEGGHGRELRAVAASYSPDGQQVGRYLATAAEDTTIRLWQYAEKKEITERGFKPLAILEKHSAGIQAMKWFGESHLLSSAGNEEFFVWRITKLESDYEALAVVCESKYPDRSADGDLRIVDFDVQEAWGDGDDGQAMMLISLALSNSTLKSYLYSTETQQWKLLAEGRYTGACLTQIRHLRVAGGDIQVLTASTDGHMAVWSAAAAVSSTSTTETEKAEYQMVALAKVHQSSIKGLDLSSPRSSSSGQSWLVITGGDDNAVHFTNLQYSSADNTYKVLSRSRVKDAHAAGVTGICTVREDGEAVEVASISNDQRVKLWRAVWKEGSEEPVKVTLLDNQYSSVADAGDVEVIKEGRLMVGGVGMEVWDFGA